MIRVKGKWAVGVIWGGNLRLEASPGEAVCLVAGQERSESGNSLEIMILVIG